MNNQPFANDQLEIACSTLGFRELGVRDAISRILACGIRHVEVCHVPGFCEHLGSLKSDGIDEIKKMLEAANASIFAVTVYPGYLNDPFPEDVRKRIKQYAEIAVALGAKFLTMPSGHMVEDDDRNRDYQAIGAALAQIAAEYRPKGLALSLEAPHWRTLAENGTEAIDLFRVLPETISATIDTSHVCRGEKQELVAFLWEFGLERVAYFHLRDVFGKDISLTPGLGHIDFPAFIRYLKANHKKALLSIELEDERLSVDQVERQICNAVAFIGDLIEARPGGKLQLHDKAFVKFLKRAALGVKPELRRHPCLIKTWPIMLLKKIKGMLAGKPRETVFDGRWMRKPVDLNLPPDFDNIELIDLESQPDRQIKVCIVGSGGAGTFHAYGYSRLKNVVVTGVSDIDFEAAENLARQAGAKPYRSLRQMIETESPNIVSVCTREWQHFAALDYLVDKNCAIFCEKIFTSRLEHALAIEKRIEARDIFFGINYNYRFKPGIWKLKGIIDNKALGELVSIHIKVHAFSYHHALDLAWHLGGRIKRIKASYFNDDKIRDFGGTDWRLFDKDIQYVPSRNIAVIMEMENQVLVTIESSYFYKTREFILGIDATFTKGAISLKGLNATDVIGDLTGISTNGMKIDLNLDRSGYFDTGYNYTFSKSIESFVNAFISKRKPETGIEEAVLNMKLEKAISKSRIQGTDGFIIEN